ncbi:uncharacterized protein LOC111058702 [Nilaparvata lugens]|uniref:uncharacterized protein LOC111058702 n=1 Tax=Nilaparvata lugens TaxID=108931 RepID=UPI00193E3BE1|nr:uncharacterized protein LOC111058702 [Nilaparvata lugens]
MADMFGGYQHTYGLPLLKQLSYEGNIDFKSVDNCFRMQDELKILLNTDGLKWSPPVVFRNTLTKVRELNMTVNEGREKPCTNVFLRDPRESSNGGFEMYNESRRGGCFPIPLPIFDNYMHPKAVILPLKERRFASLTTENGHNLLLEYYIRSTVCLKRLSRDWYDNSLVADFDNTFRSWMVENVSGSAAS